MEIQLLRKTFEENYTKPPYEWDMSRGSKDSAWSDCYLDYHVHCAWDAFQLATIKNINNIGEPL